MSDVLSYTPTVCPDAMRTAARAVVVVVVAAMPVTNQTKLLPDIGICPPASCSLPTLFIHFSFIQTCIPSLNSHDLSSLILSPVIVVLTKMYLFPLILEAGPSEPTVHLCLSLCFPVCLSGYPNLCVCLLVCTSAGRMRLNFF